MALEEAGVRLVAEGAAAYASDMKTAAGATDTFVDTTEKGGGIVSKAGGMMGSAIKGVATIAAGVGVAGFVALGKAIFDGIGDAREAAQLLAQTNAVIESTGGAAGRSAEQITDLATSLSASAGASMVGDSEVQAAENLLLTFTNIKGAVFDAATAISVDMAQALGGGAEDQAIALGKALNDPIKGVTALTRVGVTFTDQQKEQIKTMQESGNVAGAQTIILDELNKEFGGSARAAAEADGGWAQFKDTMGELAESVGAMILPLLNDLVGFLNSSVVPVVTDVVEAFGGVIETIHDAGVGSSEFAESVRFLAEKLGLPGDLIQDIVGHVQDFVKWVGDLVDTLFPAEEGITEASNALAVFGGATGDVTKAVSPLEGALADLNGIWEKVLTVVQNVMDGDMDVAQAVLPVIQRFIAEHGEEIQTFFKQTWDSIIQIINLALDLYNAIVPPVLHAIAGFIRDHGDEIQKILTGVWNAISAIITGALETIKAVLKLALDLIHGDWDAAWQDIKKIGEVQWEAIKGGIKGFLDAIAGIFNTSLGDILQLWENNWNTAVEIVGKIDWVSAGKSVVEGIIHGVSSMAGELFASLEKMAQDAYDAFMAKIKGGSPAMEFVPIGQSIVQGIMLGLQGTWPDMTNMIGNISADLIKDMDNIGKDFQNAIAEGFGATASLDRQMAKNLDEVAKIQDEFQRKIAVQDLNALQKKAQELFADPKTQADYYKMASSQEFELLKIRQQIAKATTQEEKDRLNQQLILISRAQDAELDQFYAKQKGKTSPMQDIANEINDILKAMPTKLTEDQLKIVDLLAGIYQQTAHPPSMTSTPAYTGQTTYNSSTVNMPIYSNNSPEALQQSWAVMNAGMI